MADLLFNVLRPEDYDSRVWNSAYITGIEGIPWQSHHQVAGDQFSIGREIDESGRLNIVWPSSTLGSLCLSTTSLRISDTPYQLELELARGTVHRLKSQASDWQRIGLKLPESFFPLADASLEHLLRALTTHADLAKQHEHARLATDLALEASVMLCDAFSLQALKARKQNEGRLATLLGVCWNAQHSPPQATQAMDATFNLVSIPAEMAVIESNSGKVDFRICDRQVDWAVQAGKKVCVGPLVNFQKGHLPQWMVLLDEGFDSILKTACRHAETCVERYRGRTHIWNCAAGLNVRGDMDWSDEQVLRMAVSLIETVRRADERSPVLLTIDQPWSEHLRNNADGISPLHFADALIRADLGLSGLALELNFGAGPYESYPRDLIEISRLVDRWAMLGLPLMVLLSSPITLSPTASLDSAITDWAMPRPSQGHVAPESIVRLLASKPCVHAVIWNQMTDPKLGEDNGPGDRTAGLWDATGRPKPFLQQLTQIRKEFLH